MAGAQELAIIESNGENPTVIGNGIHQVISVSSTWRNHGLFRKIMYIIFILCGQAAASLLGRLYYEKGGSKRWVSTMVQIAGFPILIPLYCYLTLSKFDGSNHMNVTKTALSIQKQGIVYVTLGLITAGTCYLFSISLEYLSISTLSLIVASQLAFNAFFSYFLNSQKFTPLIINSLVLLTISSVLLVFEGKTNRLPGVSRARYVVGFVCAIIGTAGNGLLIALQQFVLQKVLKSGSFKIVTSLVIWQLVVAFGVILVGFFASGEWKGLGMEMKEFELGKVSYVMVLVWTAICWTMFLLGSIGLVSEVSALFCNSISTVGLPIVPIAAVFVFHDKMTGLKAISLVLAIWGFISYAYQQYLDEGKTSEICEANSNTLGNSSITPPQGGDPLTLA